MAEMENNLESLMTTARRKELYLKEVEEAPMFSLKRLNHFIHKNPYLFTGIFCETNLMLLTYPLQTMKTRIQCKHHKVDICHFIKNNVEKSRNSFPHL
jgi:hypothetical protein